MRYILTISLIVLIIIQTSAQATQPCGTHYYDSIAIANDPSILERRAELHDFTLLYSSLKSANSDTMVIPVVVHVLHQYGAERVDPGQIESGIEKVNLAYKADNSNLYTVIEAFKGIIGSAKVELRLAKLDPNGKPTTGIVYYDTPTTVNANEEIYGAVENWNPEHYLNIRTVLSTENDAAAWSYHPGVTASLDGIVTIYQYINSNDHTIAHELGHYFNLDHPWGSTNDPGLEENCEIDDGIEDTPNTIGIYGTCNTEQESCGSLDNTQNIMDYSSCPAMFTMGQVTRMRAALNSSVGKRNQLWTEANLTATGVSNGYVDPGSTPVADFKSTQITTCPGSDIEFEELAFGGEASSFEWSFEGGTPASSIEKNPSVNYAEPGEYTVSLKVSNSQGTNTLTRSKHVKVTNTEKGIIAPKLISMEDTGFPEYDGNPELYWTFGNQGGNYWEVHKAEGNTAMRINNEEDINGIFNSFITSNINMSGMTNPDEITFDYAFAQRDASNTDQLKVYVSNNCGKRWALRNNISGEKLITNDGSIVKDDFIPKSSEWVQGSINFEFNANDEYVMLKFEMSSKGGNYLYIDNINIGGATSHIQTPIEALLSVHPNPAEEKLHITTQNHKGKTSLQMLNMVGQTVWAKNIANITESHVETLSLKDLNIPAGIYLVTVQSDKGQFTERIVINP